MFGMILSLCCDCKELHKPSQIKQYLLSINSTACRLVFSYFQTKSPLVIVLASGMTDIPDSVAVVQLDPRNTAYEGGSYDRPCQQAARPGYCHSQAGWNEEMETSSRLQYQWSSPAAVTGVLGAGSQCQMGLLEAEAL